MTKKLYICLITYLFILTSAHALYSHSRVIKQATIYDGKIISEFSGGRELDNDINFQLLYLFGQLKKSYLAYPTLFDFSFSIKQTSLRSDGRFSITYKAKLFVSFSHSQIPNEISVWYPIDTSEKTQVEVYQQHYGRCGRGYGTNAQSFYIEFNPRQSNCVINNQILNESKMRFSTNPQDSRGKTSPKYKRIWKDNILDVGLYVGRFSHNSLLHHDGGIRAFNVLYRELLKKLGKPTNQDSYGYNVSTTDWMGTDTTEPIFITMNYDLSNNRKLILRLALINSHEWMNPRASVLNHYNEASKSSDFVMYTGHGSQDVAFGLASENKAAGNKYQIYYLSSCEAFSNMPYRYLFQMKERAGGSRGDVDILTNDNLFNYSKHAPLAILIVDKLLKAKDNYAQMLKDIEHIKSPQEYYRDFHGPVGGIPPWAIVIGEE